jgi:F-type H+-transporting ATPase subunit b
MNSLVQPDPGLYLWTILTFLVLAGLLARFAWRPLLAALETRQASIRASLDDARKAREDLDRARADAEAVLSEARVEAGQLLARTREDGARLREELKEKAQADAAALVRNAEKQIQLETARATEQLRREAIDLSVTIASKVLQRSVSKDDNARLIDDMLRQIETGPRLS